MADSDFREMLSAARLYEAAQRFYSAVPRRFFASGRAFPAWHYFFEVTRRCNLRCRMCQYLDFLENTPAGAQKDGELTTEEWLRVISQCHRFCLVTFTGGEPLLRKDIGELLESASRRCRTHVITNATLLTEERAAQLAALAPRRTGGLGLNFVGTSIEAPGDLHDEIRSMKGAFGRTMAGMAALRAARTAARKACPRIHVTTVLQQANVPILHEMPRVAAEAGADVLNLVTETRMHDLPGLGEADPASFRPGDLSWPRIDPKQLAEALDRTRDAARDAGVALRLPRMPVSELIRYYDTGIRLADYTCRNAWNTMFIGRQGAAYSCWIKRVGNVREQTLQELWNNPEMRAFRQTCRTRLFAMCPGCCFLEHKTMRAPEGEGE